MTTSSREESNENEKAADEDNHYDRSNKSLVETNNARSAQISGINQEDSDRKRTNSNENNNKGGLSLSTEQQQQQQQQHSLYRGEQEVFRQQVNRDYVDVSSTLPPTTESVVAAPEPLQQQLAQQQEQQQQQQQLKLQDVLSHHPIEDEADTYIQDCLEENEHEENRFNRNNEGLKEVRQTILGSVPDEAKGIFRQPSEAKNSEQQQGRKTSNATLVSAAAAFSGAAASGRHKKAAVATRHKKNNPSTAETLFVLADQMKDLQDQKASLSSLAAARQRRASEEEEQQRQQQQQHDEPVSQGEILARNAAILLRRKQKERMKQKKEQQETEENADKKATTTAAEPTTSTSAASKWKNLKLAVQVADTLENAKKTDQEYADDDEEDDIEAGGTVSPEECTDNDHEQSTSTTQHHASKHKKSRKYTAHGGVVHAARSHFLDLYNWMKFRSSGLLTYVKVALVIILVFTGIAILLFYGLGNPPCGTRRDCLQGLDAATSTNSTTSDTPNIYFNFFVNKHGLGASYSWWMLFISRQAATFTLAILISAWFIDFLCLKTQYVKRLLGSFGTLFLVQAKGWPFTLFVWSVLDFAMLYGKHDFAKHWLFWQDAIKMCNRQNPAGTVTSEQGYAIALSVFLVLGVATAVKRFWVGLVFGKKMYSRYAKDLAKVMKKALLVGEVASLARDIDMEGFLLSDFGLDREAYEGFLDDDVNETAAKVSSPQSSKKHRRRSGRGGARQSIAVTAQQITDSARAAKIDELLDEWEEPDTEHGKIEKVDIASIIQFRHSLSYLGSSFPFGVAFGTAESRVESIAAVERIYHQLLQSTPERSVLTFDTLAMLALGKDGSFNEDKLTDLIRAFRPDREGDLTLLDFAKSVDSVYKELRMLRASVATTSKMNHAFEIVINITFYFFVAFIIVAVLGKNPLTVLASITAPIIGFSFCIKAASSNYFQGVMFILVQRPYDIGDRVNVSNVNVDTSGSGSAGWIVKDVDLYFTTLVLGGTNEVCTCSNGSLAASRIINHGRSPQAVISFLIKFPIDVPYQKIKVYKAALGKFIKARPREWILFSAFRPSRVESDQGFVEYSLYAKHRESWQEIGAVLNSKADLFSFALELQKKMGIRYQKPHLPVDLKVTPQAVRNLVEEGINVPAASDNAVNPVATINADSFSSLEAMFAGE